MVTQARTTWAKPLSMRMSVQLDELLTLDQALLQGKDRLLSETLRANTLSSWHVYTWRQDWSCIPGDRTKFSRRRDQKQRKKF